MFSRSLYQGTKCLLGFLSSYDVFGGFTSSSQAAKRFDVSLWVFSRVCCGNTETGSAGSYLMTTS